MRACDQSASAVWRAKDKQRGVAAVEFALVAILYFTLVFGLIELARIVYVLNTLQEVTRRAAAAAVKTDFSKSDDIEQVQQRAIFRNDAGMLAMAAPITDKHIIIDYMSVARSGNSLAMQRISPGDMPSDPARNRLNCMANPNGASCIRLVRVRVCQPGGGDACDPVSYRTLVSLIPLPFNLPISTTIMPAETMGYEAGMEPKP